MSTSPGTPAPRRLAPAPTAESAEYWAGLARHELLLQRCEACGTHLFHPRAICTACSGAKLAWVRASGLATLVSWSLVRRAVSEAYAPDLPYALAIVRLAEGPTMMTTLAQVDLDAVSIGMPLEVAFDDRPEGCTLPRFRPATA